MIDVRTVLVATAFSALLIASILYISKRVLGHRRGLRLLGHAYFLLFLGFALNGTRDVLPATLSAGFSSACWSVGTALMAFVIVKVRNLDFNLKQFAWLVAIHAAIVILAPGLDVPFRFRTIFFSLGHAAIFLFNAYLLLHKASDHERLSNSVTAVGMVLNAANLYIRAAVFVQDSRFDAGLLDNNIMQVVMALVAFVAVLTAAFGFLLMYWQVAEAQIWKTATTDVLTGVMNRRAFMDAAANEMARSNRTKRPMCVALFDLDHFKSVNDTHGHAAGDEVLKHAAKLVSSQVRQVDIFARYGGEEFVAIFPETDAEGAGIAIERILNSLRESRVRTASGKEIRVTASVGLAHWNPAQEPGCNIDTLTNRADEALYKAKREGRDRFVLWLMKGLSGRFKVLTS